MFEILFCAVSGSHKNLKLKRTNGRFHVLRGTCFFLINTTILPIILDELRHMHTCASV